MRKGRPAVSVSASTYARLKAYCEVNNVSMSQLVETRVNEYIDAQPENLLDEPVRVVEDARPSEAAAFVPEVPSTAREMYEISRRIP